VGFFLLTLQERRAQTMQNFIRELQYVIDEDHFYAKITNVLREDPVDLPLIVIYTIRDIDGQDNADNKGTSKSNSVELERRYLHGCHDIHPTFPKLLDVDRDSSTTQTTKLGTYISKAVESTDIIEVSSEDVEIFLSGLKDPKWNDRYTQAYVFSLAPNGADRARAVTFVGIV